jgi:hypothetical protein
MATLGSRKTIRIILPASTAQNPGEECWAECYDEPLVGDLISDNMTDNQLITINALSKLIADWCFVDEAGKKLPVTAANIKLLPIMDMAVISEATHLEDRLNNKRVDLAKKNS